MKWFGRTGGYWLFWTGAIYLATGLTCAVYFKQVPGEVIQLGWLLILSMPLYFPPLGRWLNMSIDWDRKMFDWIKSKTAKDYLDASKANSNVYTLPTPVATPPMPKVEPPKEEKFDSTEATYTIGKNHAGNIQLRMKLEYGSASLTMAPDAVVELIEQLAVTIRKKYNVEVTQLVFEEEEKTNEVD